MNPHYHTHTVQVEDTTHTFYMDDETYMLVSELLAEQQMEYNHLFQ